MAELTEAEEMEYQAQRYNLGDLRSGLYRAWASRHWWRRSGAYIIALVLGAEYTILVGVAIWLGLLLGTVIWHPLPSLRDYPYVIRQASGPQHDSWIAKTYYRKPDGGLLVLNQDVMVKHNSVIDMGCYNLSEQITQLDFAPYSVVVKER